MANLLQLLGLAAGPAAAFGASAQQTRPIQSIDPNTGLPVPGPIINNQINPNNSMGMRAVGNIDVTKRPIVHNSDGSISTIRSMSFGTDRGETLVPTVSDDGRILSDEDAIALYRQTGRNLGTFDTPEHATAYAQNLHNQQAAQYLPQNQSNVLQAIGGSPDAPQPAPVPQAPQQSAAPAEAPRQRRSLLDTVGRISDVLARVGGAEALYQPTLDAREDRSNMLEDRTRQIDLDALRSQIVKQQIAAGSDEATARGNAMLGAAARGLQAIQRRGGDINAAWPLLARQAGIPEDRAQALGQIFAQNPQAVEAIAAMTGQEREFGVQPFYAQGPDGQLRAYQLGRDGSIQPIQLGEGETPIDPLKFVDTGGTQVGVGTRSGQVRRILPNSVDPNTRANIGSRERIAAAGNASRERIAATRGAKGGDAGVSEAQQRIVSRLGSIRGAVDRLDRLGALVTPGETASNIGRRIRSSGPGQLVESFIGTDVSEQRQLIEQEANAIVAEMKVALELTGTMMDRPQEYQRYVNIINNPNTTKANMIKALDALERQFNSDMSRRNAPAGGGTRPRVVPRAAPRSAAPSRGGGGNAAAIAEARRRGLIP